MAEKFAELCRDTNGYGHHMKKNRFMQLVNGAALAAARCGNRHLFCLFPYNT
jgi:hypothetical protein